MEASLSLPARCRAVVIGCSAGGTSALCRLFGCLPPDYPLPVMVVQHLAADSDNSHLEVFAARARLPVVEALDKLQIEGGHIYIAPPNYHLMIESDFTFALSNDELVNYSRPAIDVLFETAAEAWGAGLAACLLTGASQDGSRGLAAVAARGGFTLVEDPDTAEYPYMPRSAIEIMRPDRVLGLDDMCACLTHLERAGG